MQKKKRTDGERERRTERGRAKSREGGGGVANSYGESIV